MESSSWPESLPSKRIRAIQELKKGRMLTNKLREMVDRPDEIESDRKSVNNVMIQIVGMFDNTLSILSSSNLNGILHNPTSDVRSLSGWDDQKSKDFNESIKTKNPLKTKRGCYKRRKNASTITTFTSTLSDDGYAWRKYGQKVILNSKHQRNYYRCSHKFEQGCQATKQVQMTDDEPSKYMITYNGLHTCNNVQKCPQIIVEAPNHRDNSTLISFETTALTENNKVGTCFLSMKHTPKVPLGHLKQEQVSSCDHHTPWDLAGLSQVPSEPMSTMSSGLDYEDMVSSGVFSSTCSTNGYEIEDIHDFDNFLFE